MKTPTWGAAFAAASVALLILVASVEVAPVHAQPIVFGQPVVHLSADPTVSPGYSAGLGTLGVRNATAQLWIKITTVNTGWMRIDGGGGGTVDGTGTANTVSKWSDGNTLANSLLTDNATTLSYNSGKFTVTASNGNSAVAGTLNSVGNFSVATNKLTVDATTGNTVVAGTLTAGLPVVVGGNTTYAVGSLAIAKAASGSTNLSTLGTIDWMYPTLSSSQGTGLSVALYHGKVTGGWIRDSLVWVPVGLAAASKTSANTYTSTAADDAQGTALSSTAVNGFAVNPGTTSGYGCALRVPAVPTTRKLRIYTAQFNNIMQVDASMTDGSATPVSLTNTSDQADSYQVWTITYNSFRPGEELLVFIRSTSRSSGSPSGNQNLFCEAFSLGTS